MINPNDAALQRIIAESPEARGQMFGGGYASEPGAVDISGNNQMTPDPNNPITWSPDTFGKWLSNPDAANPYSNPQADAPSAAPAPTWGAWASDALNSIGSAIGSLGAVGDVAGTAATGE
jgi:hypothetical protein